MSSGPQTALLCLSFAVPRGFQKSSILVIARHRLKRLYRKVILQINATLSAPPRIFLLLCLALNPPHARFSLSLSLCNEWADGERAIPLTGYCSTSILFYLTIHSSVGRFFFFQDVPGLLPAQCCFILKLRERRDKKEANDGTRSRTMTDRNVPKLVCRFNIEAQMFQGGWS